MVLIPAFIDLSATALPTKAAFSDLVPFAEAISLSLDDADAKVLPVISSTT